MKKILSKIKIKALIKYLITGLCFGGLTLYFRNPFTVELLSDKFKYLSDIFIVMSVMEFGLTALSYGSHQGTFDGLSYSLKYAVAKILPMPRLDEDVRNGYYEYKTRQQDKRKDVPYEAIIWGVVFLIPSVVFMILYNIFL